ncbi:MAG: ATP-binding protein [Bacteroidales bacterium]
MITTLGIGLAVTLVATIAASIFIVLLKKQNNSLIEELKSYRFSMSNSDVSIWEMDLQTRQFHLTHGKSRLQRNISSTECYNALHPESKELYNKAIERMISGVSKRESIPLHFILPDDSHVVYMCDMGAIYSENGEIEKLVCTHRDITEIFFAHDELSRNLQLLNQIFESSPAGMNLIDKEGRIIKYNHSFRLMTGYSLDDSMLKEYSFFEDPNIPNKVKERIRKGEDLNQLIKVYAPDNAPLSENEVPKDEFGKSKHYFNLNSVTIFNKKGEIEGYLHVISDITERIHLERRYKDLFKQRDLVLSMLPIGVEIYDKEGWMIYQNKESKDIFGEVFETPKLNLFENPNFSESNLNDIREGKPLNFQITCDFDKQRETNYSQSIYSGVKGLRIKLRVIRSSKGKIIFYILVIRDITDSIKSKKQIEEMNLKLNMAASGSNITLWDYNRLTDDFVIHVENPTEKAKPAMKQFAPLILHPDDAERELNLRNQMKLGTNTYFNFDIRYKLFPDESEWRYGTIVGHPYEIGEDGKVNKYTGYQKEVTEWIKVNQELKEAKEKAEQSNKLKSAFLANMSHEIRNPLNAIIGFADIAMDAETQEEKAEYKKIIQNNSNILLNLINDILDLSKIEAGYWQLSPTEINISDLLEDVVGMFSLRVSTNLKLIKSIPYSSCITYDLDKQRVTQVLTNFVSNAIKYTRKGTITVGYNVVDNGIKFFVSDTGIGISEKNKNKVFQRFQKFDTVAQGTGLGLSISKAIVEAMDGTIGFDSELGKGSTFWAWLPCTITTLNNKESESEENNALFMEDLFSPPTEKKRCSILIAEDNNSNYLLISTKMKEYHLTRAHNGAEAVELAKQHRFDIILMDLRMPIMDGITAITEIRKFDKEIPIIAITANAFETDRNNVMQAGGNDFVAKPIEWDKFFELIQSYC